MTDIARLHRELVTRVLGSGGTAPPEMRRAAFDDAEMNEPLRSLVNKVARHADQVTDDDIGAVRAAGLSEDQIFEVAVCAAIGQADREYNNALAALAAATGETGACEMRLQILDRGHPLRTKALFAVIRVVSRQPVVDAVKLAFYRPDFYGAGDLTHEAMRGPSDWSIGDRELMAAVVSQANDSPFCVAAHSATSTLWFRDAAKVTAALADLDTAPIEEPLRATLRMLAKLTSEHTIDADDMRAVLAAGVTACADQRRFGRRSGLRHHCPTCQCVRLRCREPRRDECRRAAPLETRISMSGLR